MVGNRNESEINAAASPFPIAEARRLRPVSAANLCGRGTCVARLGPFIGNGFGPGGRAAGVSWCLGRQLRPRICVCH